MIITQHAHIYSFHTSKFNFGEIFFLIFLSIQPLLGNDLITCHWDKIVADMPVPQTLTARGLEDGGTCASFPDFCDNHQFHVIYCVYSHSCTLF